MHTGPLSPGQKCITCLSSLVWKLFLCISSNVTELHMHTCDAVCKSYKMASFIWICQSHILLQRRFRTSRIHGRWTNDNTLQYIVILSNNTTEYGQKMTTDLYQPLSDNRIYYRSIGLDCIAFAFSSVPDILFTPCICDHTVCVFKQCGKNDVIARGNLKKVFWTPYSSGWLKVCYYVSSMSVCVLCEFAVPSWAAAALCIVSLCAVLSCAACVWKKCLKKKDKDKEKDKKKGKEKSKGGFDTEMDGGYNKVGHTHTHTHTHTQSPPADVLSLQCITVLTSGSPRTSKTVSVC